MTITTVPWNQLVWHSPPARAVVDGDVLEVETRPNGDFWRNTLYGFVHDDGHFIGAPLARELAIEVTFSGDFSHQFDQAGLMLRASPELWIKAGVELSDGVLFASAVVTRGWSDWSMSPLAAESERKPFTIRASRSGDGVTLRYQIGSDGAWRLLRVAYMPPEAEVIAGPMCCSPTRGGLVVRFERVRVGACDHRLHDE
jgi:regulation of enolase protein 1 (concanavalin A-like superfamily)